MAAVSCRAKEAVAATQETPKSTSQVRTAPVVGVVLIAIGASFWGIDGALRARLVDASGPAWSTWTIVLYEHLILTVTVAALLWRERGQLRALDRRGWGSLLVIAWGGSALATLAFTQAFREGGNPDVVVLLQKTQPLWAMGAALFVVGERPRPAIAGFLVPAGLGTYLLSFGTLSPGDALHDPQGQAAVLALVAAALWGSATAFGRRALRQIDWRMLTAMRFALALPLLAVIAAWEGALAPPAGVPAGDWVRLPAIALIPGLAAILLYYRGLRTTPAPVATLAELAFPATALIVNYVFLGATLDGSQLLGFGLLWVTIALLHWLPVRVPAAPAPRPAASRA
jgi:drug/metabolite transporter (DMT)-like permease